VSDGELNAALVPMMPEREVVDNGEDITELPTPVSIPEEALRRKPSEDTNEGYAGGCPGGYSTRTTCSSIATPEGKAKYSLAEIIANPKYTNVSPFDKLAIRYPDYDVEFTMCSTSGYAAIKTPQFVMQKIDRDKKLVTVAFHDRAHHSHIAGGVSTSPICSENTMMSSFLPEVRRCDG
jgi:hypothetical protein